MEELKFVFLKTQNQKVRAPRITWRRIKNGIIQSLAISFAAIVAATLLLSLCVLLSTCAEGKTDPAEFVGPVGPSKPKPGLDAGQGGSFGASKTAQGGSAGSESEKCVSGQQIVCDCTGDLKGVQVCNTQNTYDACKCSTQPDAETSGAGGSFATAGTGGSYGAGGSLPDDAGNCNGEVAIHLYYQGPAWAGTNSLQAWWMPPGLPPRAWGVVDECVDLLANDGVLDCVFHIPHCTTSFEFQVYLPYSRYWGDISCSVNGGCGSTIGDVALVTQGTPLQYYFKSNGIKDPNCNGNGCDPYPYKNGLVDFIP